MAVAARLSVAMALAALACSACVAPQGAPSTPPDPAAVQRGAYLAAAGDCQGCHTDLKAKGPPLAGGEAIKTKFGSFFAPNITPDKTNGIGNWSEADFLRAMRQGRGAHGEFLYPAFPYVAFSGMTDADIADLYAFLRAQPASAQPSRAGNVRFPFSIRPLLLGWRILYFRHGPLEPVAGQTAEWNRGRYLAEAVAHCSECHTPRNPLGGLEGNKAYAGNPDLDAPNITPGAKKAGKWSVSDIAEVLNSGMTPDGDYVAGDMATVAEGTAKLTDADRKAIAVYIKSMPARASTPGKPKKTAASAAS